MTKYNIFSPTCTSMIFSNSEKTDYFHSRTIAYHNILQCQKIQCKGNGKILWKFKLLNYQTVTYISLEDNGYAFYILQNVTVAISVEKNQFNTFFEMEEQKNKDIQEAKYFKHR